MSDITITQSYDAWIDTLIGLEHAWDFLHQAAAEGVDDGDTILVADSLALANRIAVRYAAIEGSIPAGPRGDMVSAHLCREGWRLQED